MSLTKDERYIIKLYEDALKDGNPLNLKDRYKIGEFFGLSDKVVKGMVKVLQQANFVKLVDEKGIHLTPHGVNLAKKLKDELENSK
jgi:Mn-dependent DtxR family transcriptional regulator